MTNDEIKPVLIRRKRLHSRFRNFYSLFVFFGRAKVMHCRPLQLKIDDVYDRHFGLTMVFYQHGITPLGLTNHLMGTARQIGFANTLFVVHNSLLQETLYFM